jgi:3-oxoacyl-(acyl-carrier-protein) synthase
MSDARAVDESVAPFSANRRGFVMGEGGFGLWLERGEGWRGRGVTPLAEIAGVGAASAAVPLNAWPDRPEPLVRTMRMALADAGIVPGEVDVVYASANATKVLDDVEGRALMELFGRSATIVTSIKGALGESGATGTAACVAAALCGADGCIPPIAGLVTPDAAFRALTLATSRLAAPARVALVNSFASGGALFSVVLRVPASA